MFSMLNACTAAVKRRPRRAGSACRARRTPSTGCSPTGTATRSPPAVTSVSRSRTRARLSPMTATVSVAARLHRLPVTRKHLAVVVIVGVGMFFDLYEVFLAGTPSTVLKTQFHVGPDDLKVVLASAFVGAVLLSRLADRPAPRVLPHAGHLLGVLGAGRVQPERRVAHRLPVPHRRRHRRRTAAVRRVPVRHPAGPIAGAADRLGVHRAGCTRRGCGQPAPAVRTR